MSIRLLLKAHRNIQGNFSCNPKAHTVLQENTEKWRLDFKRVENVIPSRATRKLGLLT